MTKPRETTLGPPVVRWLTEHQFKVYEDQT